MGQPLQFLSRLETSQLQQVADFSVRSDGVAERLVRKHVVLVLA